MTKPAPPLAPKRPHRIEQLGRVRVDDYAWMKDDNWQQVLRDPKTLRADVREHLKAENAYTNAVTKDLKPFEETLYKEMLGHIKQTDLSGPVRRGLDSVNVAGRFAPADRITVIEDVVLVGLIVSYAPNACVCAATVQLSAADHATEGTRIAQIPTIPASNDLDIRMTPGAARFSM